jgi:hypothetical protein
MENKISLEALQQLVSDELKRPNFGGELLSMSYEERQEIFKKANDSFPDYMVREGKKAIEKDWLADNRVAITNAKNLFQRLKVPKPWFIDVRIKNKLHRIAL